MITDAEISYLAGIIDGEGTIGIRKQSERIYQIRLLVNNTSEELIEYLKENYGGKKLGPYKQKGNNKDIFEWVCSGKEAIKIIKRILPYLVIKQLQAELAIKAFDDTFITNYNYKGPDQVPKYAIDKRKYYYQQMKKLNQIGKQEEVEEEDEKGSDIENVDAIEDVYKYSNINNESKLSYLAAIIDGEGTIGIYKHGDRWYQIRLNVGNTSEELIDYLRENFGGKKSGPYNQKPEKWRDVFNWECSTKEAIRLINNIKSYLVIKQEQAQLALDAWEDTFRIDYNHGNNEVSLYAIGKRECYYQQMKKLNRKGKHWKEGEEQVEITLKINKNTLKRWLGESE